MQNVIFYRLEDLDEPPDDELPPPPLDVLLEDPPLLIELPLDEEAGGGVYVEPLLLPLEERAGLEFDCSCLTLLFEVVDLELCGVDVGRVERSVFGDTDLRGVLFGAVDSGRLVPLSIVSLLPDLSTVPLLAEPLLSIVPLFPVFDLSLTVREVVPRELMVPSERRDDARSETSVFRIADLVPVTIRPLASLLTLRDTVALLSVDLLLTLVSYNPRLFDRTEEYAGRVTYPPIPIP